jgi:hypothetical protein
LELKPSFAARKIVSMFETKLLFDGMASAMIVMAAVTFVLLNMGLTAPYGKYSLNASSLWGPGIDGENPAPHTEI